MNVVFVLICMKFFNFLSSFFFGFFDILPYLIPRLIMQCICTFVIALNFIVSPFIHLLKYFIAIAGASGVVV